MTWFFEAFNFHLLFPPLQGILVVVFLQSLLIRFRYNLIHVLFKEGKLLLGRGNGKEEKSVTNHFPRLRIYRFRTDGVQSKLTRSRAGGFMRTYETNIARRYPNSPVLNSRYYAGIRLNVSRSCVYALSVAFSTSLVLHT